MNWSFISRTGVLLLACGLQAALAVEIRRGIRSSRSSKTRDETGGTASSYAQPTSSADFDFVTPQIEWVRKNGGYVNDQKIQFRRAHPENVDSRYGVFATQDLVEGELLLSIPRRIILSSEVEGEEEPNWICETASNLVREMNLGEQSKFAPYVKYLKHYVERTQQHGGQNPSVWTEKSKALLRRVIGYPDENADGGTLPPEDPAGWIEHDFREKCGKGDDDFENHVAVLILTRGWDDLLIPLFDYFGHRNGRWHNTESSSVYDEDSDVHVRALRPIKAGSELFTSYDSCSDCGGRGMIYGTPEILRDYGFVEAFPQKYIFHDQEVGFTLDERHNPDGSVVQGSELVLTWLDGMSLENEDVVFFEQELKRLKRLELTDLSTPQSGIPTQEWEAIEKYCKALATAITRLLEVKQKELENAATDDSKSKDFVQPQIDWIRSKGGYFSESIEVRRVHPENPNSRYGVFAKVDIPKSELLLNVPRSCMITSGVEDPNWICETTENLIQEMKLGEQSRFEPYVSYLKDYVDRTQKHGGQNPSVWSDAGKKALMKIVGKATHTGDVDSVLPPADPVGWIDHEWYDDCEGGDDPFEHQVLMLVLTRGWDDVLIPVFDFFGHRNGRWHNTGSSSVRNIEQGVHVRALRAIKAGEELFTSYDSCLDCEGRGNSYGTPELLRDYGFVEPLPQKFIFHDQQVGFSLDHKYDASGSVVAGSDLVLTWLGKGPTEDKLDFFEAELSRLDELRKGELISHPSNLPGHEWKVIDKYLESLLIAMKRLLEAGLDGLDDDDDECAEGECNVSNTRYDTLSEYFIEEGYEESTCDSEKAQSFKDYHTIDSIPSHQDIVFIHDPMTKDTCYSLDATWEACSSYRAHYAETMIHVPIRFLDKLSRVIWIGGEGDSILLQEIMKYPSLELVVGLESDQTITRKSMEHFGTMPHFDDDRVQWWFGDRYKSLAMLPKELYGTFDLVLATDYHDVSAPIRNGISFMTTVSLLLKPNGILVRDEVKDELMNKHFNFTAHLHTYDVPVVCHQSLLMASHQNNFLGRSPVDHPVDRLFLKDQMEDGYEFFHDFAKNPNPARLCRRGFNTEETLKEEEEEDEDEEDKNAGILLILEAEKANVELLSQSESLKTTILPLLEQEGFNVISPVSTSDKRPLLIVAMEEGYLVARAWPAEELCSFDLMLWSKFSKLEQMKSLLLKSIGSNEKSSSSFRFVVALQERFSEADTRTLGPSLPDCPKSVEQTQTETRAHSMSSIVQESVSLAISKDFAVVVCGAKGSSCAALDAVNGASDTVKHVLPIWTCPNLNEFQQDAPQKMYECEGSIVASIRDIVATKNHKVGILVLDSEAAFSMAQITHKIISRAKNRKPLFTSDLLVLAPVYISNKPQEEWRSIFVDKFRTIFLQEPVFRAEMVFGDSLNGIEMGAFSSGDDRFFEHIKDVVSNVAKHTELVGEIRSIQGGVFKIQDDFNPHFFSPADYDSQPALEQWKQQKPTGHQTFIQMELDEERAPPQSCTKIRELLVNAMARSDSANSSETNEFSQNKLSGCTLAVSWAGGNALVVWDGYDHIDINLFLWEEDSTFVKSFLREFLQGMPRLKDLNRNEFPRGHGRVVNFLKDIELRGKNPHWAESV